MTIDIGLGKENRKNVAEALKPFLADTYTLYLKTQNYHWNITGPLFQPLHQEFENQYKDLAEAADMVAEQIRALGFSSPGSYKSFSALTNIEEANDNEVIKARDMIKTLANDNETIVRSGSEALKIAQKAGDEVSADMLIERMRKHEKTAWMLRSFEE